MNVFLFIIVYLLLGVIVLTLAVIYNDSFVKIMRKSILILKLIVLKRQKIKMVKSTLVKEKKITRTQSFLENSDVVQDAVSQASADENLMNKMELDLQIHMGQALAPSTLTKKQLAKNMWILIANWSLIVLLISLAKVFGSLYLTHQELSEID